MKIIKHLVVIMFLILGIGCMHAIAADNNIVMLEAELFQNSGGWVVDQQAMDQMGSSFLLAHGLGNPVADATTAVEFPASGTYQLFVRTRDWVAPWQVEDAPGKFQVLVDGKALPTIFGTEGAEWHWQKGGTVEVGATKKITLGLHDLTGFDGRCDSIVFCSDPAFVPPNEGKSFNEFRRHALNLPDQPEDAGKFDLVVVGGGMAGTCAAISAARLGVTVALIQDRPVLGGNNSSEVRVGLSGLIHQKPYPNLGNLVDEIGPIGHWNLWEAKRDPESSRSKRILEVIEKHPEKKEHNAGPSSNYEDKRKLNAVQAEKNIKLFLNEHATRVEKEGNKIVAIIAQNIRSNRETRFRGRLFADCTGDGNLGFLAGADYRMGREAKSETGESEAPEKADKQVMGTSVQWYATKKDTPVTFPLCPWALQFNEKTCSKSTRGDWDWEAGMNRDQITDIEQIRDHALRAAYGNWAYLKNSSAGKEKYASWKLDWVAYIGGKRESRRLMGDVILKQQDVVGLTEFPDASVTTTWSIDLHYPSPQNRKDFPGQEFRSIAKHVKVKPYPIPYRCFYSRNIDNLFMAGRHISVTHVALGTIRVQRTTGMMGEVVGMAASLCKQHNTDPRGVYKDHLDELKKLMEKGVGKNP
ncbi:MAG: FAD-dependent oxidoreductase [Kiritimatiellae bacterium]|nr:FAD-dependent oxidoreductase [Kiritimatiellia bacterium]